MTFVLINCVEKIWYISSRYTAMRYCHPFYHTARSLSLSPLRPLCAFSGLQSLEFASIMALTETTIFCNTKLLTYTQHADGRYSSEEAGRDRQIERKRVARWRNKIISGNSKVWRIRMPGNCIRRQKCVSGGTCVFVCVCAIRAQVHHAPLNYFLYFVNVWIIRFWFGGRTGS